MYGGVVFDYWQRTASTSIIQLQSMRGSTDMHRTVSATEPFLLPDLKFGTICHRNCDTWTSALYNSGTCWNRISSCFSQPWRIVTFWLLRLRRFLLSLLTYLLGAISRTRWKTKLRLQLITVKKSHLGFQLERKSSILNGRNAYAIIGDQKVICKGRNDRLMLVLLIYLFHVYSSEMRSYRLLHNLLHQRRHSMFPWRAVLPWVTVLSLSLPRAPGTACLPSSHRPRRC